MGTLRATAGICAIAMLLAASSLNAAGVDELPALNDPPGDERLDGKFVWADLFTTDPTAAARFYEGMFGWTSTTFLREGRSYTLLRHQGRPVAGIVERPVGATDTSRAHWVNYFAVSDMARMIALITKSGGKVLAPVRDFPRRGAQAIIADKEGAVLGLLRSASGDPADYQAEMGDWIWVELFAKQPDVAADFYRTVLGYEVTAMATAVKDRRFVLASGGFARAGIGSAPAKEGSQPAWLGFVRVENTDAAAIRATDLGGRVLVGPQLSHLGTRFAIVADPTGAAIAVIEFNASQTIPSP